MHNIKIFTDDAYITLQNITKYHDTYKYEFHSQILTECVAL